MTLLQKFKTLFIVPMFVTLVSCATVPVNCNCSHSLSIVPPIESFVKIVSYINTTATSTASGVIIAQVNDNNTIIATAKHVCVGSEKMKIFDVDTAQYEALILNTNQNHDLCLITTKTKIDFPPVKLSKKKPSVGDIAFNLAAPLGIHDDHMTLLFHGHYTGKYHIPLEDFPLDVYTIPGRGGSSGSPVFNEKWELIGIISLGNKMFEHMMLSVGYEHLYEYLTILEPELPRLALLTNVQDFLDTPAAEPNPDVELDQTSVDKVSTP